MGTVIYCNLELELKIQIVFTIAAHFNRRYNLRTYHWIKFLSTVRNTLFLTCH